MKIRGMRLRWSFLRARSNASPPPLTKRRGELEVELDVTLSEVEVLFILANKTVTLQCNFCNPQ
jgi:hypothetical protein